jgi:hypothetical protein
MTMTMTMRPIVLAGCLALVASCGDGAIDGNPEADARAGSTADAPTGATATGLHVVTGTGGAAGHLVDADGHSR